MPIHSFFSRSSNGGSWLGWSLDVKKNLFSLFLLLQNSIFEQQMAYMPEMTVHPLYDIISFFFSLSFTT